ncbi:hypothetical protein F4819DRAFT_36716 [Hypoxylon fuscum]|nr:hypothetical protein F4819DRAFT_36716 [Hypoxylon fuscum]
MRFTIRNGGDQLRLLNIYNQWVESDYSPIWARDNFLQQRSLTRARNVREQLRRICHRIFGNLPSCGTDTQAMRRAFTAGFFPNAAKLQRSGDGYQTLRTGQSIFIHPSSTVSSEHPPPKVIIYHELALTSKEFARSVLPIESKWLAEFAPHVYKSETLEKLEDRKLPKQRSTRR